MEVDLKKMLTVHLQSGMREQDMKAGTQQLVLSLFEKDAHSASAVRKEGVRWILVLSLLSPFHSIQDPSSWHGATHIQGGSSLSNKTFLETPHGHN